MYIYIDFRRNFSIHNTNLNKSTHIKTGVFLLFLKLFTEKQKEKNWDPLGRVSS